MLFFTTSEAITIELVKVDDAPGSLQMPSLKWGILAICRPYSHR